MTTATETETLEILNDGLDRGRILSWMLFPNSPKLREAFFLRELAQQTVNRADSPSATIEIAASALCTLLDSPGRVEFASLRAEATKRGTVAGDLLGSVYLLHKSGAHRPSLRKAIDIYKDHALGPEQAPAPTYGDGSALKRSGRTLRTYMAEFEKVAHLWAAFQMNVGPNAISPVQGDVFHDPSATKIFLGVAKAIGEFAGSFVPLGTKPAKPVLDPEVILRIPADIPPVVLNIRQDSGLV